MNNQMITNFEKEFDFKEYSDFLLQKNIEEFIGNILTNNIHPFTNKLNEFISLPELGSHLISQRVSGIYTHHGIYVGNKKVIEYSGFSEGPKIDDLVNINNNRSPISIISIEEFGKGNGFKIKLHPNSKSSREEIVKRAYERLNENEYNLFFNNCEQFAIYCIYGIASSKQTQGLFKASTNIFKNTRINFVSEINQLRKSFLSYLNDDISSEKLFEDIGHISTTSISSIYYAGFFQTVIPIPFVGAFIGAFVGYTLGSMLYDTGLFSITGDSEIVKIAKDKRAKLTKIANIIIPIIEKSKIDFDIYVDKYFADRKKYFDNIFNKIDNLIINGEYQEQIGGLSKISIASTNKDISYKDIEEFKKFLEFNRKN
ncbi:lecithin retinol acyltransferase family protein [Aliarcobacter butzleri]|uniref:lecithin retinol acyltransferase family protein n=1 Tax=Aliarcobacter butzleri TaxID=28197 RepID=UPI0021B2FE6C|nr:lecithin retinol acyltransferase family protein [Aliarcobacter butzleri]MCT7562354.1 lecithin retinol acyltransferase family protein [Aliarcobacter butzleri]